MLYIWNAAGQVFSLQGTSDSTSALSVTGMAGVDLWLCLVVLRSFPSGAPLRSAWMLITLAAAARTASGVLAQFLGTDWLLNPLVWTGHAKSGLIEQIWLVALIAGGPVRLALLAAAMRAVLRTCGNSASGFGPAPRIGRCPASSACSLSAGSVRPAWRLSQAGRSALRIGSRSPGCLFCACLFLQAMLLRRSVARMGNGLITRGWMALVCAILLTGAAEVALWVMPYFSLTLPLAMFGTLIRLPIAAAFALVPAYQVAAQCRAMGPASSPPEDLPPGVPELAR